MSLRKSTFRYVENEIYEYHNTKYALKEWDKHIIYSTPPHQEIRSTDIQNPTLTLVTMLATNKLRIRMIEVIDAIDFTLDDADDEIQIVLEYKYWMRPKLSWKDVAISHNVGPTTIYKWRQAFVEEVAMRLGYY